MKKYLLLLYFLFQVVLSAQALAQLKIIVAFPTGGPTDRIARVLAERLGDELKQSVVVENKPGASGSIAANYVIRSSAPNSTLFLSSAGALTINPAIDPKLGYDPFKDFKPVSLVADTTSVLVVGAPTDIVDAADLAERIKKDSTKEYTAGSSGIGATSHLSMEMFQEGADVKILHVPYKGAAAVFTDLVGKRVDMFFGDLPGVQSLIQAEKLKVLGIIGDQQSPLLPGVRTLAEQGITGVIPTGWYGMVMAATATDAVIQAMSKALEKSLKDPKVISQLEFMGAMPMYQSTADFKVFLNKDAGRWDALIKRRNLKLEN